MQSTVESIPNRGRGSAERLQTNIYAESWRILRGCLSYAAVAVIGELVITVLKETTTAGAGLLFASVIIWSYLFYAAHAQILLPPERDKAADSKRVFGFAIRTFGVVLVVAVPVGALAFFVAAGMPATGDPEATKGLVILFLLPLAGLLTLLVLCSVGTLLPAYVADLGRGFGAALSRARRQFFWIAGRLLVGPGVVYTLSLAGPSILGVVAGSDGPILSETYVPDPMVTLTSLLSYAIQAYATVMVAVILSRAYLRETPMADPAVPRVFD